MEYIGLAALLEMFSFNIQSHLWNKKVGVTTSLQNKWCFGAPLPICMANVMLIEGMHLLMLFMQASSNMHFA